MSWFLVAVLNPLFHAAVNHIDKHLISRYFRGGEVGALVLFSALFAVFALPIIWLIEPAVLAISFTKIVILILNGSFLVLAYICYFHALNKDEASYVAPWFQLVPVFSFVLAYFVLGEVLSYSQLIGSVVVIFGVLIFSLNLKSRGLKFKKAVAWLMTVSSLLYAANVVLFKLIAQTEGFWLSLFWDFAGKVITGIFILIFVTTYRRQFVRVLRGNSLAVIGLNAINEIIGIVGEGALIYATMLAPVVFVQIVGGLQPLFVFIFGVILTLFWPQFGQEDLSSRAVWQKISGIVLIILGGWWLIK